MIVLYSFVLPSNTMYVVDWALIALNERTNSDWFCLLLSTAVSASVPEVEGMIINLKNAPGEGGWGWYRFLRNYL